MGLVAPSPRSRHLGEDLSEQSGDDLQLMPTDPIVGPVGGAPVFGHLEERFRPFRPRSAPVEAGPASREVYRRIELRGAASKWSLLSCPKHLKQRALNHFYPPCTPWPGCSTATGDDYAFISRIKSQWVDGASPSEGVGWQSPDYSSESSNSQRSETRWKSAEPNASLTWGRSVTGDPFVSKLKSYCTFTPRTSIVEIGPGYGRLLKSILRLDLPFSRYVGVDLSASNCKWLEDKFGDERTSFLNADAATALLPSPFDVCISSLTLKHIYPSFGKLLLHLSTQASPGGRLVFDLLEASFVSLLGNLARMWVGRVLPDGFQRENRSISESLAQRTGMKMLTDFLKTGRYGFFERDGVTYIGYYTQGAVDGIIKLGRLRMVAYDHVWHDSVHRRLLVVAEAPEQPALRR